MTCKIAPNSFFISNRLGPTEDILRTGKPLRERQEEKRRKVPVLVPILNLLKQEVNYARHAKSQRDIQSHICRHEISWGLTESMTASGRATFALVRPSLFVAFSAICFFRHRSIAFDILLWVKQWTIERTSHTHTHEIKKEPFFQDHSIGLQASRQIILREGRERNLAVSVSFYYCPGGG